jgi:subtilase family serine protease
MIPSRILRFIWRTCLCLLALGVVSQSALAAGANPLSVRLATPESLAAPAGHGGPQYGLFQCQVGLSLGACYDPYQMRHAYQIDSLINAGYDGTGHTIVIIDAFQSPNIVEQLNTFIAFYGLPSMNGLGGPPNASLGTFTQVAPDGLTAFVPGDGNMTGWAEEISLDVLWAHAIAPGANIVLVLAKSNQDTDLQSALSYAVANNLGDVISQSYGENESCMDPTLLSQQHDTFATATEQGTTLFASAGDQGAALTTCDGNSWVKAVSTPAVDPLVTAVGGTELHAAGYCLVSLGCDPSANPAPGTYQGEITWNEGPPFGDFQTSFGSTLSTGGGFSVLFDEPPYQKGTAGLHGGKQRAMPDVAYNAAVLHGVLTFLDIPGIPAGFYRFGGTSAGSPQWAAITVISNQLAGERLGFLNKAMYNAGKHGGAPFNDITSGTNSAVEFDASNNPVTVIGFDAGAGWDATTGTGTPIASSLAEFLVQNVSPGDGQSAISTTKPKPHPKPIVPGSKDPH